MHKVRRKIAALATLVAFNFILILLNPVAFVVGIFMFDDPASAESLLNWVLFFLITGYSFPLSILNIYICKKYKLTKMEVLSWLFIFVSIIMLYYYYSKAL